jgi:alpha-methylacyl-CoA racemase
MMQKIHGTGPLVGMTVIEMAAIGPSPFAAMLLADMGARVVRIDRIGGPTASFDIDPTQDVLSRNRESLALDLKRPEARDIVLELCTSASILIEGFRPGVMERLGLGPQACLERNPALVYGRVTGWGQQGPLAATAGHDLNFIAVSGCLEGIGRPAEPPVAPLNFVGDYGGGGMLLVAGVLAASLSAQRTGVGQVVDAAILDGSALFLSAFMGFAHMGLWRPERGVNLLDSGAYFYDCYVTRDGKYLAVGALEPKFFAEFLRRIGLDPSRWRQDEPQQWPRLRSELAQIIRERDRADWMRVFEGSDACVSPVLSMQEAPGHAHNRAREVFVERFGITQPAPAPRFSATPSDIRTAPPKIGQHTRQILLERGYSNSAIERLLEEGVAATPH